MKQIYIKPSMESIMVEPILMQAATIERFNVGGQSSQWEEKGDVKPVTPPGSGPLHTGAKRGKLIWEDEEGWD